MTTLENALAERIAEREKRKRHRWYVETFVGVEPDFDKWQADINAIRARYDLNLTEDLEPFHVTYADAPVNQKAIDEAEYRGGFWRAIWALLVGGKV
jgi:hypothetical protein